MHSENSVKKDRNKEHLYILHMIDFFQVKWFKCLTQEFDFGF